MTKGLATGLLVLLFSMKSFAQLDFSMSLEALNSQHLIHYFQFYNTGKYLKSDNKLKSMLGSTFYLKYNFLKGSHTGLSIGIPFGFDFRNTKDTNGLYYRHYHLMLDINTGCYKAGLYDERVSKFGFYFGVGVGFFQSAHLPTYSEPTVNEIPVGAHIDGIDTTWYAHGKVKDERLLSSFGVMAHLGMSFNYYGYHKPYMFLLPTGVRFSYHQGVDNGGSYFTMGILYNTKVLYPLIWSITQSRKSTKRWMSM